MRKHLISFFLLGALVFCVHSVKAQVTNYAAQFTGNSTITIEPITELSGSTSYTVQFWMNPSVWHANSSLYATGSGNKIFSAVLGATSGELIFKAGNETIKITDSSIAVNSWAQVTFINDEGNVKVFINNTQVAPDITSLRNSIPDMTSEFLIGGNGYEGRIDEFRLWGTALDNEYTLYNNTLNKFHPQWDQLIVYYKFDQDLCPNVVDYKFAHHGSFVNGSSRSVVTDNPDFVYRKAMAYTSFSRWADRKIDRDKYLLANEVLILGIGIDENGEASINFPDNTGTITNGSYLSEYEGRQGVLSLNGAGAGMNIGPGALQPSDYYSFQTWIYLNEWTEGAFLFKKEVSDVQGFSIRLGSENTKSLIVRLNGAEYRKDNAITTRQWMFIGVTLYEKEPKAENNNVYKTFMFTVNSTSGFPLESDCPTTTPSTTLPVGVNETDAYIGVNLNAKLDNTAIYHKTFDSSSMKNMKDAPYITPDFTTMVAAADPFQLCNSLWKYDLADNVGFDTYSHTNYINIMRSAAKNYRGQKYIMSISAYGTAKNLFSYAEKRAKLAASLAKVAMVYDGVDLDMEWPSGDTEWKNYGLFIKDLREAMTAIDPNKTKTLSVSLHNVARSLPKEYHQYVDEFTFQQYGPANDPFTWNNFISNSNSILDNYEPSKVILSYATTTSKGRKSPSGESSTTGIRNLIDDSYTPDVNIFTGKDGYTYYFTGINQVKDRARYVIEHNAGGLFYWDMGNDLLTSDKNSFVKHASYVINSNVDTLVVDIHASSIDEHQRMTKTKKAVLSPNPAQDYVSIILPAGAILQGVNVFDMSGCLVLSEDSTKSNNLNVSSLTLGLYTLRITDSKGNIYLSKLNKSK